MKLYVGNMPFSMGEEDLRKLFSEHGEVASANVIVNRDTGRPRGFGFVEMSEEAANKAMSALNEHEVDGRKLVVSEARPRRDRDDRGGGGHRNRY